MLHAGHSAFLQDIVTRKMGQHAHVQQFFYFDYFCHMCMAIFYFVSFCSIGARICKRCSFGQFRPDVKRQGHQPLDVSWYPNLPWLSTSRLWLNFVPLLAQSHRISPERARCSFTQLEVPAACISSVHGHSLRWSILYSTWHLRLWKGIEDCPVFFYVIWVSVQSTSKTSVVRIGSPDLNVPSSSVHQVTEQYGKQPETFLQLAQHSIQCKASFANCRGSSVGGHAHHHSVVEWWECRAGCGARHDHPGLATIRGGWERIELSVKACCWRNCNS